MKIKTAFGLVVMLVGVVVLLYGVYNVLTTEYIEANIPTLVTNGFVLITIGIVVLINGIVLQGFKNIYALIIHLLANIPYALAIMGIYNLGQQATPPTDPQEYVMATLIYWIIGAALNIGGIIANRFAKKETAQPPEPKTA